MSRYIGYYFQAIVYNLEGEARIVEGPQRVSNVDIEVARYRRTMIATFFLLLLWHQLFLWREKIEYLTRYTASQTEYLIVKHRKGKVEHIKG